VKIGTVVLFFGLLTSAVNSFAEISLGGSNSPEIASVGSEGKSTVNPSILARNDRFGSSDPSVPNEGFQSPLKPFLEEVGRFSCGMKPYVRSGCRIGDCVCDKNGRNCEWQVICN
jgi:hypothetical protein